MEILIVVQQRPSGSQGWINKLIEFVTDWSHKRNAGFERLKFRC